MLQPSLTLSILISARLSVADICSHLPGYTVHGTSCFKLSDNKDNWTDAETSCVADGGHLASIHSSEEQAFVANISGVHGPWIGLSGTPPNMAWSDSTYLDYENWHGTDPDENGVSCTLARASLGHSWQDRACSTTRKYMCRIDVMQRKTFFTKIPGGVPVDAAVVPSSTQKVRSVDECALRCVENVQCVHFIVSEDGGKYLCETYSSLYRHPTLTPPTDNYKKIV